MFEQPLAGRLNHLIDGFKARALIPSFEVIGEFTNLFNIVNVSGINQIVPVRVNSNNPLDPTNGVPILTRTNIFSLESVKLWADGIWADGIWDGKQARYDLEGQPLNILELAERVINDWEAFLTRQGL